MCFYSRFIYKILLKFVKYFVEGIREYFVEGIREYFVEGIR